MLMYGKEASNRKQEIDSQLYTLRNAGYYGIPLIPHIKEYKY